MTNPLPFPHRQDESPASAAVRASRSGDRVVRDAALAYLAAIEQARTTTPSSTEAAPMSETPRTVPAGRLPGTMPTEPVGPGDTYTYDQLQATRGRAPLQPGDVVRYLPGSGGTRVRIVWVVEAPDRTRSPLLAADAQRQGAESWTPDGRAFVQLVAKADLKLAPSRRRTRSGWVAELRLVQAGPNHVPTPRRTAADFAQATEIRAVFRSPGVQELVRATCGRHRQIVDANLGTIQVSGDRWRVDIGDRSYTASRTEAMAWADGVLGGRVFGTDAR